MTDFTGTRFDGDGRERLEVDDPRDVLPGTRPMRVTRGQARLLLEIFDAQGSSSHSSQGGMLWVVKEWCRVRGLGLAVRGSRREGGYYAERRD